MSLLHPHDHTATLDILEAKIEALNRKLGRAQAADDQEAVAEFENEIEAVRQAHFLLSGYA